MTDIVKLLLEVNFNPNRRLSAICFINNIIDRWIEYIVVGINFKHLNLNFTIFTIFFALCYIFY